MNQFQAVVYTRQGCHLCDDAIEMLVESGLTVETIDIDADPELRGRYNECVPVVWIEGRERFRGRIDPRLLGRLVKQIRKR